MSQVLCNISSSAGVETRHYKTISLEAGDATTIVSALLDEFAMDGIDYKSKMITADLDGCNTMQGCHAGVITLLQKEVPQLSSLGSSTAHNLSNAMMHAVTASAPDIKEVLVDLYMDVGGAKGKGLKKKKEFEAVGRSIGIDVKPIKRFVSTRFRTLRTCIEPVLDNYLALVTFYKGLKKPTARQQRLQVRKLSLYDS